MECLYRLTEKNKKPSLFSGFFVYRKKTSNFFYHINTGQASNRFEQDCRSQEKSNDAKIVPSQRICSIPQSVMADLTDNIPKNEGAQKNVERALCQYIGIMPFYWHSGQAVCGINGQFQQHQPLLRKQECQHQPCAEALRPVLRRFGPVADSCGELHRLLADPE